MADDARARDNVDDAHARSRLPDPYRTTYVRAAGDLRVRVHNGVTYYESDFMASQEMWTEQGARQGGRGQDDGGRDDGRRDGGGRDGAVRDGGARGGRGRDGAARDGGLKHGGGRRDKGLRQEKRQEGIELLNQIPPEKALSQDDRVKAALERYRSKRAQAVAEAKGPVGRAKSTGKKEAGGKPKGKKKGEKGPDPEHDMVKAYEDDYGYDAESPAPTMDIDSTGQPYLSHISRSATLSDEEMSSCTE